MAFSALCFKAGTGFLKSQSQNVEGQVPFEMAARDIQAGARWMDGWGDLCILRPRRGEDTASTTGPAHCQGWGG